MSGKRRQHTEEKLEKLSEEATAAESPGQSRKTGGLQEGASSKQQDWRDTWTLEKLFRGYLQQQSCEEKVIKQNTKHT